LDFREINDTRLKNTRAKRDRVSLLASLSGKRRLVTGYRIFARCRRHRMHRPSGNHMESIVYRTRARVPPRRDATRRDATRDTALGGMLLWPVSSIQGPVSSLRASDSSLSLNRASRKIYLETVTIIRAAADAARPDGCESFYVEWIVSRPFHGHSVRSREILRRLPTRGETSREFFPKKCLYGREMRPLRFKWNQTMLWHHVNCY